MGKNVNSNFSQRTQAEKVGRSLRGLGRPATKQELAVICGLSIERVGSLLSKLDGVIRADKHRWGFAEWIDDEYQGISVEIMQRIEEDGGSTRLSRILDELPRLFGVSERSVRSKLASPAFRIENGWVSAVAKPALLLGRLKDVASGRDRHGNLYWTFTMYERHLRGFSVTSVPPELAVALGCPLGRKSYVNVQRPNEVPRISVIWRKPSTSGPEIGRIAPSLRAIAAADGDRVALIIHANQTVSIVQQSDVLEAGNVRIVSEGNGCTMSLLAEGDDKGKSVTGVRIMTPIIGRLDIPVATRTDCVDRWSGSES